MTDLFATPRRTAHDATLPEPAIWVPNQPETWPWRIGRLKRNVEMRVYQARWAHGEPVVLTHTAPAGSLVRINMVSRFGDVGITDRIADSSSYHARVKLDDLEMFG